MPSLLNNFRLNNQSTTVFKVAVQGADLEDLIVCVCYSQYNNGILLLRSVQNLIIVIDKSKCCHTQVVDIYLAMKQLGKCPSLFTSTLVNNCFSIYRIALQCNEYCYQRGPV